MVAGAGSAPPTCYSRILSLSKEIMASFKNLQNTEPVDPCVEMLPKLYLDIHNYCVLTKLRNFVAYPACQRVPQVSALKEKIRSLYTIMISFCRRVCQLPYIATNTAASREIQLPLTSVELDQAPTLIFSTACCLPTAHL
uniref:Cytokine like 1 n=1 Tax=Terrapene triunguis TaxID=2587831 RepID=A0A674ITI2_9SAUR